MANCIITGCRLIIPLQGRSLWGDLHQQAASLIFNGAPGIGAHEDSRSDEPFIPFVQDVSERQILLLGHYMFERRGVIVFEANCARYNDAAWKHVCEGANRSYLQLIAGIQNTKL